MEHIMIIISMSCSFCLFNVEFDVDLIKNEDKEKQQQQQQVK